MPTTSTGVAYDRRPGSVPGGPTLLFLHAGVADRRMWDPQWEELPAELDLGRLDLRGFGQSDVAPSTGSFTHAADVLTAMDELGLGRAHLVGSSLGAGVAVEVALIAPERVAALVLCPPGGSLIDSLTESLRRFIDREVVALDSGDIDAAVEANVDTWLVGMGRSPSDVPPHVADQVRTMQRAAFEASVRLGDAEESELDPPALERLAAITVPTLVLVGAHDMDAIHVATDRLRRDVTTAIVVEWPDTAHLPSMERPRDFSDLLREWVSRTSL